jgi:NAD(P)H-dependent FMN reductase
MTTLILNGSPNPKGRVARMLEEIAAGASTANRVEWINVYDLSMRPCRGCMRCRPDGCCLLPEDDAHRIGRMIQEADSLVIGTPTHWANMSSQLKVLMDRNVPVFMGQTAKGFPLGRHRGKPALVVTACSTPWLFDLLAGQSRGAVRAVRKILRAGGFRVRACLVEAGSGKQRAFSESRLARRARKVGAALGKGGSPETVSQAC